VCNDAPRGFYYSEMLQSQKIFSSLSAVWTIEPSVLTTICHYSIRPDDVPYCPDSRQTKHHPSGRRVSPSKPSIVSRRFYPACIRPDVLAARLDASQYSISFIFLSKFQEREDRSTVWTMWYPVRTRVSLRQESQFKYHRPDV
jgi:hypothetical protein